MSPAAPAQIAQGVLAHERRALAKAITLIESTLAADRTLADELLNSLLPHSGAALRVGCSNVTAARLGPCTTGAATCWVQAASRLTRPSDRSRRRAEGMGKV